MMDILVLLLQYGHEKYPNAKAELELFFKQKFSEHNFTYVVIDNKIDNEVYEVVDEVIYINGNNRCWEFSGWDYAIDKLPKILVNYDLVCFATSAVFAFGKSWLDSLDVKHFEKCVQNKILCGHIDTTQETLELEGCKFNRWIRTSLFFMSPSTLSSVGHLTTYENKDVIFSDYPTNPFLESFSCNTELKDKIISWLTLPDSSYHSRFDLDYETFSYFKAKSLAILNEYSLFLRTIKTKIGVLDFGNSANMHTNEKINIVTPVTHEDEYNKCIATNKYISDKQIHLVKVDNSISNTQLPIIYNKFIENYILVDQGWICFCHQDFMFLENPSNVLKKCDTNSLYGVFGARLVKNIANQYIQEYVGEILQPSVDNFSYEVLGSKYPDEAEVDTLDCVVFIVHSSLLMKYGLYFDTSLCFHQYVEEICLHAKQSYSIPVKVLKLKSLHNKNNNVKLTDVFFKDRNYVATKYYNYPSAGTCGVYGVAGEVFNTIVPIKPYTKSIFQIYNENKQINSDDFNTSSVLVEHMLKNESKILDVGCASGYNGAFFKKKGHCSIFGMEYDIESIIQAKHSNVYEEVFHVDLNNFSTYEFAFLYNYFDAIYYGDVLEHVQDPQDVLMKLKNFLNPDGCFFVSIPNVGHMNVVSSLLNGNFPYSDLGILDKTHIKFYTWKTLALLFAQSKLEVTEATATFATDSELGRFYTSKKFPKEFYNLFLSNVHFFVLQYISKLKHSDLDQDILFSLNSKKLYDAPLNNKASLQIKEPFIKNVGRYSEIRWHAQDCLEIFFQAKNTGNVLDALLSTGLFDPEWYNFSYPCKNIADIHPLIHYIQRGWKLGWDPSEFFCTKFYLDKYPDVQISGECPLLHYAYVGIFEGRQVME